MISRVTAVTLLAVVLALSSGPAGATQLERDVVQLQETATPPPAPKAPPPATTASLGAIFATNSPAWRSVVACDTKSAGALVINVLPESPAWHKLREGDVIVAIDGEAVMDADRATLMLRSPNTITHRISVVTADGNSRSMTLTLAPLSASAHDYLTHALLGNNDPLAQYLLAREIADAAEGVHLARLLSRGNPAFAEAYAVEASRRADVLVGHRATTGPDEIDLIRHALSEAIRLDPNSADIRATAARVNLRLGSADAAAALATDAIARDDGSSSAHNILGVTQLAVGQAHAAVPELRRAVDLDPYENSYYQDLARGYDALGDGRDARATRNALEALERASREGTDPSHGRAAQIGLETLAVVLAVSLFAVLGRRRVVEVALVRGATAPPGPMSFSGRTLALFEGAAAAGVWSAVIPYFGPALGIAPDSTWRLQFADHIVPGLLVVVSACFGVAWSLRTSRLRQDAIVRLSTPIFLSGLWMVSTHLPLILQALRHERPWVLAVFHSSAGPATICLAACLRRSVRAATTDEAEPDLASLG